MTDIVERLDRRIGERRKMTSPLYQVILGGKATQRLLQQFVLHRYPVKEVWTRGLLAIAARVEDYDVRRSLVENAYEEETGALSGSQRHLETFIRFGTAVGLSRDEIVHGPVAPETKALVDHNLAACTGDGWHFTAGLASVVLLMEGQPPIVTERGSSMLSVMRDVYGLPPSGYEFFVHHASSGVDASAPSDLEDDHADAARQLLRRYCTTAELQEQAVAALERALELRHRHFDMILEVGYDPSEPVFRYAEAA